MNPRLFLVAVVLVIADQATKFLVQSFIAENSLIEILPVVNFTYVINRGAAFSMLAHLPYANYIFMPIAFVATIAIGYWLYFHGHKEPRINQYAMLLIMAGACGNLIDRIRFGYVIDFISVHYEDWHYPSFNIADSSITIGALLLFIGIFQVSRYAQENAQTDGKNKVAKITSGKKASGENKVTKVTSNKNASTKK